MCPKHPDTILQNVCGEDTCPKCSEEYYLNVKLPKGPPGPEIDMTYGWSGKDEHYSVDRSNVNIKELYEFFFQKEYPY